MAVGESEAVEDAVCELETVAEAEAGDEGEEVGAGDIDLAALGETVALAEGAPDAEAARDGLAAAEAEAAVEPVAEAVGDVEARPDADEVSVDTADRLGVERGVGVGLAVGLGDGGAHEGCTPLGGMPPVHAQLPSVVLFDSVPPTPVAGAAHEKTYEVAPNVGAEGDTAAKAKAPRGGCDSARTSVAFSARE